MKIIVPALFAMTAMNCVDEFPEPTEDEISTTESELAAVCNLAGPQSATVLLSAVTGANPAFRSVDLRVYNNNGRYLCSSSGNHRFSVQLFQGRYSVAAFVGGQRCAGREFVIRAGTTNRVALDVGHCLR